MEAAVVRKAYQGVFNIVRFNWHFYAIAAFVIALLFVCSAFGDRIMLWICVSLAAGILVSTVVSLSVSYYVYDHSHLYGFHWIKRIAADAPQTIVNIHAGFDETSSILQKHLPGARLVVYDFYDPVKHTEASIERARKAYPPFDGTIKITTDVLPLPTASVDLIFNIFALHEVRSTAERIGFIKAQLAVLKDEGTCVIVEHLRDVSNFLAYTIGFLHFFSLREWKGNFLCAGFDVERKFKITPFVTVFFLKKQNGNTR